MSFEAKWYGPKYQDEGWVPAPRYLMRRARILQHLKRMRPGKLVEIGCASGALLSELADKGFDCTGVESSDVALSIARRMNGDTIELLCEPQQSWSGTFDYCMALEVLEHIEDDQTALKKWASWLRPGGAMVLSVPAHPRLWNARDVWAGHYRRYCRRDLETAFEDAGLKVEALECYGFPLANILEFIIARNYRGINLKKSREQSIDKTKQTAQSGIERSTDVKMFNYYTHFPGSWLLRAMIFIQSLFLKFDIGNGYLVIAVKR